MNENGVRCLCPDLEWKWRYIVEHLREGKNKKHDRTTIRQRCDALCMAILFSLQKDIKKRSPDEIAHVVESAHTLPFPNVA